MTDFMSCTKYITAGIFFIIISMNVKMAIFFSVLQ